MIAANDKQFGMRADAPDSGLVGRACAVLKVLRMLRRWDIPIAAMNIGRRGELPHVTVTVDKTRSIAELLDAAGPRRYFAPPRQGGAIRAMAVLGEVLVEWEVPQ
ncbi:MAG: hypothetical protein LBJ59_12020 [Zoogloeaceae bacterium]|jgi:hypothetical protein|nr:hypothetical protein [Zoogloeaceae bacterium]